MMFGDGSQVSSIEDSQIIKWFESSGLVLYALDDYERSPWLGEYNRLQTIADTDGTHTELVEHSFSLVYGDPTSDEEPNLFIRVSQTSRPTARELLASEYERPALRSARPLAVSPTTVELSVGGRPVSWHGERTNLAWAVQGKVGGEYLSVIGVRWPSEQIRLVAVSGIEPYVRARSEFVERHRQLHYGSP